MMRKARLPLLYRVDGNREMGLGHLVRARSLCAQLEQRGIISIILTYSSDNIVKSIFPDDSNIQHIPPDADVNQFIAIMRERYRTSILIQDVRDTDSESVQFLQTLGMMIIHFDDLGTGRKLVDILIDANIPSEKASECVMPVCFFGEKYMVLDACIEKFHQRSKIIPPKISKILVSFGGSDPRNLTPWVIEILSKKYTAYDVTVVTGQGYAEPRVISTLCQKNGFTHLHNITTMAEELYTSDIAVISGGVTLYEAAACGVPAVVLPQVKHQYHIAQRFEQNGICICPFNHLDQTEDVVMLTIDKLIRDRELRQAMSNNGKSLVDGNGANRICDIIESIYDKTFGEKKNAQLQK
ncbi:MAG: glycosyltransferase [Candidatus Auribacterota bacterium]|nr:glycosyltransferase [Candidatus Auribacterota bacterium]